MINAQDAVKFSGLGVHSETMEHQILHLVLACLRTNDVARALQNERNGHQAHH
jgi:hypothetical protein